MLRQRIITALVLVGLLLGSLFAASSWPFSILTLALMAAAGWEWGRLNQASDFAAILLGTAVALAGAFSIYSGWAAVDVAEAALPPVLLWWSVVVLWLVGSAVGLRMGPKSWPQLPRLVRWVFGLLALWAAWLALAQAHRIGINFMLSVLCLVWMADVAAYFGGRRFGRRKLAISISPGKSWEGVWSGMLGVLLLALLWVWLDRRFGFDGPSLYTRLFEGLGVIGGEVALLWLVGLGVMGDLIESLVKRAAGAKDSSNLLPGHGGVLDRVDALLPVLPAALAVLTLTARSVG